jgi:preprotein translocase SecF subunit
MKLLQLFPTKPAFKFIRLRSYAAVLSIALAIASVALFFTWGLNFGIDFTGGAKMVVSTEGPADLGRIRTLVGSLGLGDAQVQQFGEANTVSIVVETQPGSDADQQRVATIIRNALGAEFSGGITVGSQEIVGPKVSGELVVSGTQAVVLAIIMMLVYIWFRFEWQFSLGAVIALVHDVVLTIGVFSVLELEFGLPIIAAILTIVGYSMNDTVVVYDRVRENLRKYKRMELADLLDLSINETLARTVVTSLTTLLALFSLYIFGGEVIRGFTFAMIWGVFVGTYSSIFVAGPFLLVSGVKRDWSAAAQKTAAGARP